MILTGKTKEDFLRYYGDEISHLEEIEYDFLLESSIIRNAYYVDFFDSIGIYIIISPSDNSKNWFYTILGEDILSPFYKMYQSLDDFENRQEALSEAIKKANEIYNNKN